MCCYAIVGSKGGGGAKPSGSTGKSTYGAVDSSKSSSSTGRSSPSPPPPACEGITANVFQNVRRSNPCANPNPCTVVVNANASTAASCLAWSPLSYWDGSSCVGRCELLGGVLDPVNAMNCSLRNESIGIYNASDTNMSLFMAPVPCGVWLGPRDSSWSKSWFSSQCTAILENRWDTVQAVVSECNTTMRTPGCRFLDTNQQLVPLCRESNLTVCGVQVSCPSKNPCGLFPDLESNLNNKYMQCATQTHLALNVSADEANCGRWTPYAFLLDGFCVSSCGRLDNKCILNGASVPPCNVQRSFQDGSIVSISPPVCSVPMPSDTFAGFRNGFYGMSGVANSKCLVSIGCTSSAICFQFEGLNITPLVYESSASVPLCNGDASKLCKVEYPCSVPEPVSVSECSPRVLRISEAMYTGMGARSCEWFLARDIITILAWFMAAVSVWGFGISNAPLLGVLWTSLGFRPESTYSETPWARGCMDVSLYLVLVAVLCLWEVVLMLIIISGSFLALRNCLFTGYKAIPTKDPTNVASVRLVP